MWRCFVRDQARVPSVAGAGSSLFRNRNNFFQLYCLDVPLHWLHTFDDPTSIFLHGRHGLATPGHTRYPQPLLPA